MCVCVYILCALLYHILHERVWQTRRQVRRRACIKPKTHARTYKAATQARNGATTAATRQGDSPHLAAMAMVWHAPFTRSHARAHEHRSIETRSLLASGVRKCVRAIDT